MILTIKPQHKTDFEYYLLALIKPLGNIFLFSYKPFTFIMNCDRFIINNLTIKGAMPCYTRLSLSGIQGI